MKDLGSFAGQAIYKQAKKGKAMPAKINKRTDALIVVDVQNDFADPNGNLYVQGGEEIVPIINNLIAQARTAGAYIVFTQDWHPERTPHFDTGGGPWPVHCVKDTWGAQLHPGLNAASFDPSVKKGTGGEDGYSGFSYKNVETGEVFNTKLKALLNNAGVERVFIVGIATDVCVKETALDAVRKGFYTVVLEPATRGVTPEGTGSAIKEMRDAGVVVEESV